MSENPSTDTPQTTATPAEINKAALFCANFGIFALWPYLTMKTDERLMWMSRQQLLLTAVLIAVAIPLGLLAWIPVIDIIAKIIGSLVGLAGVVLVVLCLVQAFQGGRYEIPVLSKYVDKVP